MTDDEIVIRTCDVITPAGVGLDALWTALRRGESAVRDERVDLGANDELSVAVARIADFDPLEHFAAHELRVLDRYQQIGTVAARRAALEYQQGCGPLCGDRCGVIVGSVLGPMATSLANHASFLDGGYRRVPPSAVTSTMRSSLATGVAREFGITGPCLTLSTECASGLGVLAQAASWLRVGVVDRVLVGCSDAPIVPYILSLFVRLKALSYGDAAAERAAPFAMHRNGFALGEGAAFCVVERAGSAGEGPTVGVVRSVVEYTDDASVRTDSDGDAYARVISSAVERSLADVGDVVAVNAHATGTHGNDDAEATAINRVLGSAVPVCAVKATTGHMLATSGLAEVFVSCLTASTGVVPPVAGLTAASAIAAVPNACLAPLLGPPGLVVSNSFGLGGSLASCVVAPVAESRSPSPSS